MCWPVLRVYAAESAGFDIRRVDVKRSGLPFGECCCCAFVTVAGIQTQESLAADLGQRIGTGSAILLIDEPLVAEKAVPRMKADVTKRTRSK